MIFLGRLDCINDDTARVTLTDPSGSIFDATLPATSLRGIEEGARFTLSIDGASATFAPEPYHELSDEEWEALRQKTAETVRDWKEEDDY